MRRVLFLAVLALVTARPALASSITFEDAAITALAPPVAFFDVGTAPSLGTTPQSWTYLNVGGVDVTFNGGVFLNKENLSGDATNVYATASRFLDGAVTSAGDTFTLPLRIALKNSITQLGTSVTNLSLQVVNGGAGTYRLSDDSGHSVDQILANGQQFDGFVTLFLPVAGPNVAVTFVSATDPFRDGVRGWDFAIDNIAFNEDRITSPVPEPATCTLLGAGIAALMARRRKR